MSDDIEVFHRDGRRLRLRKGDMIPDGFCMRVPHAIMDGVSPSAVAIADASMAVYDDAYVKALPDALRAYGLTQDDGSPAAIAARGKARLTVLQNAGAALADAARQRMIQSYGSRPSAENDVQRQNAVADAQRVNDAAYDWFRTQGASDHGQLAGRAEGARIVREHHLTNAWKGDR